MSCPTRRKPLLAALLAAFALPAVSNAEDDRAPTSSLPAVTVREAAPAVDPNTPANTVSVTQEDLRLRNVPNSEDAVKYMPNLRIRKRFIGDRNAPIEVRGMSNIQSARGLVLADGILLSNFLSSQHETAPRWSMVLPEEIERVDVIYGPYSALYSGNAMGAAVLFTTRMPDTLMASANLLVHEQDFEYKGTDDSYKGFVTNAFAGDRWGDFSAMLGISRLEATSQPTAFVTLPLSTTAADGSETAIANGYYPVQNRNGGDVMLIGVGGGGIETTHQDEFKLKLGYDFTPLLEGRITVSTWTMDRISGREGNTTYLRDAGGNPVYNGPVAIEGFRYNVGNTSFSPRAGEEEHWMYAASLKSKNPEGWNYEAVASLYDMKENVTGTSTTPPPGAFAGGAGTLNKWDGSGWQTLDLKLERTPLPDERHWWAFGYHYDQYDMDQKNYATDDWRTTRETSLVNTFLGKTRTQALFVQDAWQFAELWKTVLGLRYEEWRALDGSRSVGTDPDVPYADRKENAWSPKAAIEYAPDADWRARLSVAQAYRFPTVTELFQGSISGDDIVNSDPNLEPERGLFTDFTIEQRVRNGVMRLSFYQEDTKDVLFSQRNTIVVPNVTNYQNIDHVRVRGIEVAYDASGVFDPRLDLSASIAFNDSEILENRNNPATEGNEFYRIPRERASLVATWRQNDQLAFTLGGRYSGKQFGSLENTDVNPNALDGVSTYTVFDAKVSYEPVEHLSLGLGVDNLMDERYFVGHPYSGRTYYADAKLSY
jgi:iron complex outermembrane receptor protein